MPLSYQIGTDNNSDHYSGSALPNELHFDNLSGVIYGIPTPKFYRLRK